jgi:outer membrane lipoprotein-sorting protein
MRKWIITMVVLFWVQGALAEDLTAVDIIRKAMGHYRGQTSYSQMTMIIHRSDWQREMTMRVWTEGDKQTLVRVIEPPRDAGNDTLSVDGSMWTYSPKTNRVTEVTPSMMSENWMGSDFSNRDVSRGTTITEQYDHTILELRERDGHQVYVIQSVPHEDAAVEWGSEVLHIRDDWIVLEQQFRDQDDVLVKTLRALEIDMMSGRSVATVMRMGREGAPDEWTELRTAAVEFDVELPPNLFTLSNLRTPGE